MIECLQDLSLSFRENWSNAWGSPHAWLDKCRRLYRNCERKISSSLHMAVLAFTVLLLKRL